MTLVHSAKCLLISLAKLGCSSSRRSSLAKTELSQNASRLVPSLTMIVAGGMIAYGGLLAIVAAVVLGLIAIGLVAWVAALLGGLVIAGIGYALVRAGLASFRATGSEATTND